jgi:hypothetical protein
MTRTNRRDDIDTDDIVYRYLLGESSKQIAADLACAVRTVFLRLKKAGIESRPVGKVHFTGARHHNWKGGRVVLPSGYVRLSIEGRTVLEHRHVAEREIGRPLRDDEDVHHDNRQSDDNHPANLVVLTKSEHAKLHAVQRTGGSNPSAKLTKQEVDEIRFLRSEERVKIRVLVAEYKVSKNTIRRILSGQSWAGQDGGS